MRRKQKAYEEETESIRRPKGNRKATSKAK
jgi:hypothetical protein